MATRDLARQQASQDANQGSNQEAPRRETASRPMVRKFRGVATRIETEHSWFDGGLHAVTRHWSSDDAEIAYEVAKHSLILTLDGGTALTGSRIGGEVIYEGLDRPGALTFAPAGVDRVGWYRGADMRFIAFFFDPALAAQFAWLQGVADAPAEVNGSDAVIEGLLRALAREMDAGLRHDAVFMEHMLALLAHRLSSRAKAPVLTPPPESRSGLNARQMRRIADYVDAHFSRELSLSQLADVAQMSNDSFARAFKKTTGLTPYQYLLERRVRRAETMLCETDDAIAAIALATGFSSQSHLTTTFRRVNGRTPHAYRQSNRG